MVDRRKVIPFPQRRTPDDREVVEVHRCAQAEAMVVRSLLESEGIPTFLRSRLAQSVHPFTVGAQGEVVVVVPRAEAERSRRLLARIAAAPRSHLP
jgi:hypothetical protein